MAHANLLDEIPPADLQRLREHADELAANDPNEGKRKRTILDAQQSIKNAGAFDALAELEQAYAARRMSDVDAALVVGVRHGRARSATYLDEDEQALLAEVTALVLDLTDWQRLRVLVAALRIELGP